MNNIRVTAFALAAAVAFAGCASTQVRPDDASNDATADEVKAPLVTGMDKPPLKASAAQMFDAIGKPMENGFGLDVDLDALVRRGIVEDRAEMEGGYSLVQLLAPFVGDATMVKSSLAKPAAELLVYASLVDRTLPFHDVKRLGLWAPLDGEEAEVKDMLQKGVLIIGTEATQVDNKVLLETAATMIRLGAAALSDEKKEGEADAAGGDSAKTPYVMKGDKLCTVVEDEKPALCIYGGDGVIAGGYENSLDQLLAMSSAAAAEAAQPGETAGIQVAPRPGFGGLWVSVKEKGTLVLTTADESNGDATVKVVAHANNPMAAAQVAPIIEMGLMQRLQSRREFDMATSVALQNARKTLEADADAPAALKEVAASMTLESITDPYSVGIMDPDNVKFSKDGDDLVLTLKAPAGYVDHLAITARNMGTLKRRLVIGLATAMSEAAKKGFEKTINENASSAGQDAAAGEEGSASESEQLPGVDVTSAPDTAKAPAKAKAPGKARR